MLACTSYKFIDKKIKHEKHSLYNGKCSENTHFNMKDSLMLLCFVPREFCALGARMELYRDEDMSTQSVRAARYGVDAQYDIFAVMFTLSDICVSERGGSFLYAFLFETPYGLLWASSDGTVMEKRDCVDFGKIRVLPRSGERAQNPRVQIGQMNENQQFAKHRFKNS